MFLEFKIVVHKQILVGRPLYILIVFIRICVIYMYLYTKWFVTPGHVFKLTVDVLYCVIL